MHRVTPLRSALSALEAVRDDHGQRAILVGFSGGKDSIVTAKLAVQVFGRGNVHAFHMRLVPGLRFLEDPLERLADKIGMDLAYYPDPDASRALREGVYCVAQPGISKALIKYRDVEAYALAQAGCIWTALGWRKSDNYSRLFVLRPGLVGPPKSPRRVFPVGDWKDGDIRAALRAWGLQPVPAVRTRDGARSSGISLNPAVLSAIAKRWPDDFKRIEEVFPHVRAAVYRYDTDQVPDRDSTANEPEGHPGS